MIKRLRPAYSPEELKRVYSVQHDHSKFSDHILRVTKTIEVGRERFSDAYSAADLSCGDGYILSQLHIPKSYYGDVVPDPSWNYVGPIEDTIDQIPYVDLFVLCETLEHLDDPWLVLRKIREKAASLLLSTPETPDGWVDENEEHYWSWDRHDIEGILKETGWYPTSFNNTIPPRGYMFQIWSCQ